MRLVGLVSAFREGPLVRGAIASALQATSEVRVFEGPAGMAAEGPESDYTGLPVEVVRGEWRNDAAKRTAMLEACRPFTEPTWGVWVDGDEVLRNAELLAGWLQRFEWEDEGKPVTVGEFPGERMGWPIRLVELDGGVVFCRGKVVRLDRIDGYSVSSSVFRNALGMLEGQGNHVEQVFTDEREAGYVGFGNKVHAMFADLNRLFLPEWLVGQPWLLHRSPLRHPLRAGVRMQDQETAELERTGVTEDGENAAELSAETLRRLGVMLP